MFVFFFTSCFPPEQSLNDLFLSPMFANSSSHQSRHAVDLHRLLSLALRCWKTMRQPSTSQDASSSSDRKAMNDKLLAAIADTRGQVSALSKQQDCLMEMMMKLDERLTALELRSKAETAAESATKHVEGSAGGDAGRTAALVESKTDGTDDEDDARALSAASSEPVPAALDRILQEVLKVQKHLAKEQ
jgi:hypothetical protein